MVLRGFLVKNEYKDIVWFPLVIYVNMHEMFVFDWFYDVSEYKVNVMINKNPQGNVLILTRSRSGSDLDSLPRESCRKCIDSDQEPLRLWSGSVSLRKRNDSG